MQFRFGLPGPLSVIHDGRAALMTSLSFRRGRAFGDVPSELLAKHHSCHK